MPRIHRAASRRLPAFTLIELLVSVALLTISLVSLLTMWGMCRRAIESTRDVGEYYAVARQEVERDKARGFDDIFLDASGNAAVDGPFRTDYDRNSQPLTTANLAANAAATTGAEYRAVSTYFLVKTGTEPRAVHQLGIQKVRVYRRSASGAPFSETNALKVHETTVFYSTSQQWRHTVQP